MIAPTVALVSYECRQRSLHVRAIRTRFPTASTKTCTCFMLGLNATAVTASLWPRNDRSNVGSSEMAPCRRTATRHPALRTPWNTGNLASRSPVLGGGSVALLQRQARWTRGHESVSCQG
jgi:hypothetical protein